mgnify:FL=1
MKKALRYLTLLPGVLFIGISLRWLIDPAGAAADRGGSHRDGLGPGDGRQHRESGDRLMRRRGYPTTRTYPGVEMKLLRIALLVCSLPVAAGAVADPMSSAIQERVERLMIESDYTIRGVAILAREAIAEFYAAREYQPAWKTREKMAQLNEITEFA